EDEKQEQAGQAEQQREPINLKAAEQLNPTAESLGQGQGEVKEPGGRPTVLKRPALDRLVDDALWQVERSEIEGQRQEHDQKDDQLVAFRVTPNVTEQAFVHCEQIISTLVWCRVPKKITAGLNGK
ncbi:MAG TPA: hypothetical protein VKA90_02420, partial [Beijerinckiaceae bacterium]|nr:hypothetical protein [Beijerinckiaceae bacterium]